MVVDFFITLLFSTIDGKLTKKSFTMIMTMTMTMTMTMMFQNFLTKPLLV